MKRKRRGSRQVVGEKLYGLFYFGLKRKSVPMPGVDRNDDRAVDARCELLAGAIEKLVAAGYSDRARDFAEQLGAAKSQKQINVVLDAVKSVLEASSMGDGIVFQKLGEQWTDGSLAKQHKDHIKPKKSAHLDVFTLGAYVYPLVGNKPVGRFTEEDGDRVMRMLPDHLGPAARRHVAQAMHRLLNLAVYPLKIIKANPLPKGFLPKLGPEKAKQYLYPDEDLKLVRCIEIPIVFRLFYGVLDREGFRSVSELKALDWVDFDLERGAVRLDKNKTDDPRAWAMDPGVARAIDTWHKMRPELAKPFAEIPEERHHAARFREHVQLAGIDRDGLLVGSEHRLRLRLHDLRATFVTVSLANGKSEVWVADRTGHKSSTQIAGYRRAARMHSELNLGVLKPLDTALVWSESPTCQVIVKEPSRKRTKKGAVSSGGERGIRTLGTVAGTHDFQSSTASHEDAISRKNKHADDTTRPVAGAFDSHLTSLSADLSQARVGWSAIESALESMSDGEGGVQ